ncbi:Pyridoxal-5'-phosphate-dependent protein beta subunit [Parvibaculum lavamentivorans DS-1]|uniref:Pyridoxal-5'-phosphate-dependent protein beta subunit n=1 Tax=Parvibaculum lavamentivorans (strain DS-1 / DSM 13023 / NCIMB 13966) TaxID=402881 RepID=A7HW14_PARL1|nr:threonine/serine dehydratase [Parvibaculum lavamentivorans]ABS64097.1 Pyridoxal-5'-phosphate-dependent protein beta subunit [Parvibaculum lavamentivorans DS-1]
MKTDLPDAADVRAAAARIAGVAVRTPLLEFPALNARTGGRVFVKPEVLQRTGSFKFRGACNRLSQLSSAEAPGGIVAWSSGNHAQGVAAAAALRGLAACIVMPSDAPQLKVARTRGFGAEIVFYDRLKENREEIGRGLAAARGAIIVPPYDDPDIIAGQGTAALEIAEDASRLGVGLDAVLVPAGGGGLAAGTALAIGALLPDAKVYCVEPAQFDDHAQSLASGARIENPSGGHSICDALMAPLPGEVTFAINGPRLAGGLSVTDGEVEAAMRFAFEEMKLVVEPGGAVALAALLSGKHDARGAAVAIILSGGNVDAALFSRVLSAG